MCVAAIAWDAHPELLLVAIGNRDELHDRPTAALSRWEDGSSIIAGRDLLAGGTWFGVTDNGRFALLTNFRNPDGYEDRTRSRGAVVASMLNGSEPSDIMLMKPFNAAVFSRNDARLLTNYPHAKSYALTSGIIGLSNGPHAAPWPKTVRLCAALESWMGQRNGDQKGLFEALRNEEPALPGQSDDGPDGYLSPIFIRDARYGTRCSTAVIIRRDGRGVIEERGFDPEGRETATRHVSFTWG